MLKNNSELILEELKKRRQKEQIIEVDEETVKVVIFLLSHDLFAFRGMEIKEILPFVPVFYVPGSPDYIPGVINVRGDIESVIQVSKFLGLPESNTSAKSRIAIAQADGIRSGLLLDSVEDVIDIPASSIKPTLSTLSSTVKEYVSGEFAYGDRTVTILDIARIFAKLVT